MFVVYTYVLNVNYLSLFLKILEDTLKRLAIYRILALCYM